MTENRMPLPTEAQLSAGTDNRHYVTWRDLKNAHILGVFEIASGAEQFWGTCYPGDFGRRRCRVFLLPVVWKQFFEVAGRVLGQALDDIGEVSPGLDAVASAGREDGEDDCVVFCAFVAAEEEPCLFPHGYIFHLPLGVVVVYAQVAVGDVLSEGCPVIEAVEQGLAERAFRLRESVLSLAARSESYPAVVRPPALA